MKYNVLYILITVLFMNMTLQAQRGIRIAYIDTEYILQNVPEYQEANTQLDKKVQEWKSDIDKKLSVVSNKRQELEAERILLTKELYNERLEDIQTEENEVLDYQQKRFGPEGDYITQKNQLVQPIQDQIFATVQEIAETRNYDFIFDKSADLTMLFSAKQYDVSEFVLRSITRSATRKQAQSRSERREAEDEELVPEINTAKEERELALAEKKTARELEIEERRQKQLEEREAAKTAAEARRQQILEDRQKAREAKSGGAPAGKSSDDTKKEDTQSKEASQKSAKELMEEQRAQKLKEREELRQRALQARQGNNPPSMEENEEPKKEERKTEAAAKKEEATIKSDETSKDDKKDTKAENDTIKDNKTPQQLMEEERQKKIKEREEQRQALLDARSKQANSQKETPDEKTADSTKAEKPLTAQEKMEAERQKKIEEREKRRLELEERKQKILDERKKQKEQQEAEKKADSTKNNN